MDGVDAELVVAVVVVDDDAEDGVTAVAAFDRLLPVVGPRSASC